ncbi:small GTPase superfamily [Mycena filopes]|nr:small GTPase superfamily [Mycena filopes]
MNSIKCVIVGDDAVGKTALLAAYTTNTFPAGHIPTVLGAHSEAVQVGENQTDFSVCDTNGSERDDYRSRPLVYPQTHVFLICFSVASRASFKNVREKWLPEVQHFCGRAVPWILVGTQVDLRDAGGGAVDVNNGKPVLEAAAGEKLARQLKAVKYVECSAKTQQGVKDAFSEAIAAAVQYQQSSVPAVEQGRGCVVL